MKNRLIFSLLFIFWIFNFGKALSSEGAFFIAVSQNLKKIPSNSDAIKFRLLKEYGAMWLSKDLQVLLPESIAFSSAAETNTFHKKLELAKMPNSQCTLQKAALKALLQAQGKAQDIGLNITPRGNDSCIRSYEVTEQLWLSRVKPNLAYYVSQNKLSQSKANQILKQSIWTQVDSILKLEQQGLLFDKYRQTSILNSVAAPGSSQHISGLAFDAAEYANPQVRNILNQYGWFQTVVNDLPHFTYLGKVNESYLLKNGLKKTYKNGFIFWTPDI
jgi:hypothetical protein